MAESLAEVSTISSSSARLAWLNAEARGRRCQTAQGLPIRFIDAGERSHRLYEIAIAATGEVPTRTLGDGAWHDLLNAMVWLHWPQSKAQLNRLHASQPQGPRGPWRDRATLIDENGLIWLQTDAQLCVWLRERRWNALLREGRARWPQAVYAFGHALLHKLMQPFKAITAHVLILESAAVPGISSEGFPAIPEVDRLLAKTLANAVDWSTGRALNEADEESQASSAADASDRGLDAKLRLKLFPLPVLGIPGWTAANADPAFYDDPVVFR